MERALLIGFDSAWTAGNSGAMTGAMLLEDGAYQDLGPPHVVNYPQAEALILKWQGEFAPDRTLILLDQPTVVRNAEGQRPVEHIVCSAVSARRGGMQPANTSRTEMFGPDAPMWQFLSRFGGPADPIHPAGDTSVLETYPVLTMISLLWTLPDSRALGRLPKYNPGRRATFALDDWRYVCELAAGVLRDRGLHKTVGWLEEAAGKNKPRKNDQDRLDACLCLLVALHLIEGNDCMMVGDRSSGYIVAPHGSELTAELEGRCASTGKVPSEWVQIFHLERSAALSCSVEPEMEKPWHAMTAAERTAARIVQNREIERTLRSDSRWTVVS